MGAERRTNRVKKVERLKPGVHDKINFNKNVKQHDLPETLGAEAENILQRF